MKERIKQNPLTTIAGALILATVFTFIWFAKISASESMPLVAVGVALLASKDKLFIDNFFPGNNQDKQNDQ